jgi:hypothetical protein
MNLRVLLLASLAGTGCTAPTVAATAARVIPDLQPPQKRQATVATAERLVKRTTPEPIASDLVSPFSPPSFERPEGGAVGAVSTPRGPAGSPPPAPAPLTVRQTLENLAGQITPSGMIMMRGAPRLVIGNKPFEVGTRFTATFNNQDYELELIAIDRTTFTLRYRGEEITRPIKPVR